MYVRLYLRTYGHEAMIYLKRKWEKLGVCNMERLLREVNRIQYYIDKWIEERLLGAGTLQTVCHLET